ncbi:tetratricopeptide repeat protein [Magnetospirillum sulfuroxidans]|uniref:Tetratricopeptide repeat protein n=1 Tax=Magnetospirillum sulfuroxidans TaxID=611300 RepID=A0ABS5IF90_9PROT|nr:tetratricopeptide repeat protein [Magnetospirillum sulfuroxidans]MBR9973082.1 tetratricopeptide repeat protein [Magnetospirillum sulfuroxidans]
MATMHWAAMAMMAGVMTACSPQGAPSNQGRDNRPPGGLTSHSGLGAFLAGRLAQGQGDTDDAADFYAAALASDPDNADLLQRTFTLMVAEGRLDSAIPMARRLQDLDAESAMPVLVAGLADVRGGLLGQAESRFAGLPRRGLNGLVGPLMTAWALAGQGQYEPAIAALEPLSQTKGFAGVKAYHAALINDLAGRPEAAEAGYGEALSGQLSIRGIEAAGSFFQRHGQAERAKELYDRYQREHPETLLFDGASLLKAGHGIAPAVPDAQAGMAEALFDVATLMRQGNGQDAAIVFSRLALYMRADFPLAGAVLGDMLSAQDRREAANAVYGEIAPTAAAHAYGQLRIAVNLEELGDTASALSRLATLVKDRPDSLDPLVTKGDILRRKKRFAEAAEAYGEAINRVGADLSMQHWPLLYSRGICLERTKQWTGAEADFKKALELKPDQPDVLNYLGYTWVDAGINLEEGRAMLEKAVSLRPRDGAVIDSLGWALYRLGDYHNAVKFLERAVELKAEDPTLNDHLGDAYWQVGRVSEAMFQWQRAMGLDPEPEQIAPLKEKLRSGQVPANPVVK